MCLRRLIPVIAFVFAGTALADDASFVDWARQHAQPIEADGKAFASLDGRLEGVRLIGVGESVHEAEPFLSFRGALLQDLIRRNRVTALVLESGLPEVRAMDAYIKGRTSTVDFNAALPGGHGTLSGMRRTMEWLREWNLGAGREHPVSIYGADLPVRSGSMVPALDALAELARGNAEIESSIGEIRPIAQQVAHTWWKGAAGKYAPLPPESKAALASGVARLSAAVDRASDLDAERLEWARRNAFVVRQFEEMLRLGAFHPAMSRNRTMAGNAIWVVGRLPPGERAVFWAHNAHVQRARVKSPSLPPPGDYPSTGSFLHEALGKQYFAIGTAYGGPSLDKSTAPESNGVDAALGEALQQPFLLGLAPDRSTAAKWLEVDRPMRFQVGSLTLALGSAFDAVAYFPAASRAERAEAAR